MDIYSINSSYIEYLRGFDKNIMENEKEYGTIRPYVGVVFKINDYNYYVPLSSPKDSDYEIKDSKKVLRKSVIPIHRIKIVTKFIKDEVEEEKINFLGKLLFSNMIPVPDNQISLIDVDNWGDEKHKNIFQNQIRYLRKNEKKLKNGHAKVIYNQKINNGSANYLKSTVDFKLLEEKCDIYNSILGNVNEVAID